MEPGPPRSRLRAGDVRLHLEPEREFGLAAHHSPSLIDLARRPPRWRPAGRRLRHRDVAPAGGNGTIQPGNGTTERIRCNANYRPRGSSGAEIDLDLRCASDSYNFDLTGQFSADDGNRITGQWTERTRNIGGSVIGTVRGESLQVHVESSGFAADLSMLTRGRRQSVTIDSQGGGQTVKASITLSRR